MKKIVIIFLMMFLLTGCGNKTLTCSKSDSQSGMDINYKIEVIFNSNVASSMKMKTNVKISEEYIEYMDILKTNLENEIKSEFGDGNFKYSTSSKDNKISLEIESKDGSFSLSNDNKYGTVKEQLQSEGFTCK